MVFMVYIQKSFITQAVRWFYAQNKLYGFYGVYGFYFLKMTMLIKRN